MAGTFDFAVPELGSRDVLSPIKLSKEMDDYIANYVADDQRIVYDLNAQPGVGYRYEQKELLELGGPRERIYFDPAKVHAGIVTCGGLCPGLNDVIRAIVMCLWYRYGVRRISGIRFGYRGLLPDYGLSTLELNPAVVDYIHRMGGTILGSSRGGGTRTAEIVNSIERMNLNVLFTIGGDGTQRGAIAIGEEIRGRGLKVAVVGVPKTIDNDLSFIERSFGFETAVSKAVEAVEGAHTEAHDAVNGIGMVKVMGRESGFIAAHTALAISEVNSVLVPEVPFALEGEGGLLAWLKDRLARRNHALILVAEGAGQNLFPATEVTDASGNPKLGDIGALLKSRITHYFSHADIEISLKYIDPSYIIRSAPANPSDSIYCARLGTNAVHAAMCGKSLILIGLVNGCFVHVPMTTAVSRRNRVDPESPLWRDVIEATGQPVLFE
jgi:6-phosphofructokinase 1